MTLEVHDITDADSRGSEPIHLNGRLVGRVTHGGYGWRVGKSLALAMVEPALGDIGQHLDVTILGKAYRATVVAETPFDPSNERLRA